MKWASIRGRMATGENGQKRPPGSAVSPPTASQPESFSMNPILTTCLLVLPLSLWAQGTPEAPVLAEAGPHHSVWTWTTTDPDELGQPVTAEHSYVEVATGLNVLNPATQRWERSVEAFEVTPQGDFVARRGQHHVVIAANVNAGGSVDVELPSGQTLRSNPMGLAFFSLTTGRNVLLAEVKDCPGELAEPNIVLFSDAFDTVPAALLYRNTKAGFDQSVVILANPGSPQEWGFAAEEDVRLEVWTEFREGAQPVREVQISAEGLMDETPDFGAMQIGQGRAFLLN